MRPGKRLPTNALGAGEKSTEVWAASWWATTTTVRGAWRSPASATTFQVGREGSSRRRNHWRPPVMSSAMAAQAKTPAARAGARRPLRAAPPARRAQQPHGPPVRPVGALLLDARLAAVLGQALGDPVGGPALALGGRAPLEGGEMAHDALELGAQGGVGGRGHRRATI